MNNQPSTKQGKKIIKTFIVSKDLFPNSKDALKFVQSLLGKDNVIKYSPLWGMRDELGSIMFHDLNHYFYIYD